MIAQKRNQWARFVYSDFMSKIALEDSLDESLEPMANFMEKLASWKSTSNAITVPSTMTKCDRDVPMSNHDPWSVTQKKKWRPMISQKINTIRNKAFWGILVTYWTLLDDDQAMVARSVPGGWRKGGQGRRAHMKQLHKIRAPCGENFSIIISKMTEWYNVLPNDLYPCHHPKIPILLSSSFSNDVLSMSRQENSSYSANSSVGRLN